MRFSCAHSRMSAGYERLCPASRHARIAQNRRSAAPRYRVPRRRGQFSQGSACGSRPSTARAGYRMVTLRRARVARSMPAGFDVDPVAVARLVDRRCQLVGVPEALAKEAQRNRCADPDAGKRMNALGHVAFVADEAEFEALAGRGAELDDQEIGPVQSTGSCGSRSASGHCVVETSLVKEAFCGAASAASKRSAHASAPISVLSNLIAPPESP